MHWDYPPQACPAAVGALQIQREWLFLHDQYNGTREGDYDLAERYFQGAVAIDSALKACPVQGCEMGTYDETATPPVDGCPISREIDAALALQRRAIARVQDEQDKRRKMEREANRLLVCGAGSLALQAHKIDQNRLKEELPPEERRELMWRATALMEAPGLVAQCTLCRLEPGATSPVIPRERSAETCPMKAQLEASLQKAQNSPQQRPSRS